MTNLVLFLITLLPSLILCISFKWDKQFTIDKVYSCKLIPLSNGLTHIFWIQQFTGDIPKSTPMHRMLFPNGTLTEGKAIDPRIVSCYSSLDMPAQASDDGMHLMIAYDAQKYTSNYDDREESLYYEIFFTESFNGGKDWSDPVLLPRRDKQDFRSRQSPSMVLEKDTGRIWISFIAEGILSICVREPGKTSFEKEIDHPTRYIEGLTYFGYTIDKAASKKYLHLFWTADSRDVIHSRSDDNGQTWEDGVVTKEVKEWSISIATVNTQTTESGLFVQVFYKNDIRIIWSKNHGKTWNDPVRVGSDFHHYNGICACGVNDTGMVFSANAKIIFGNGFVRFSRPYEKSFTTLPYPFSALKESDLSYPMINCVYMGNGQYSVTLAAGDRGEWSHNFARGTLTDVRMTQ